MAKVAARMVERRADAARWYSMLQHALTVDRAAVGAGDALAIVCAAARWLSLIA